jgi:hypothetical protein
MPIILMGAYHCMLCLWLWLWALALSLLTSKLSLQEEHHACTLARCVRAPLSDPGASWSHWLSLSLCLPLPLSLSLWLYLPCLGLLLIFLRLCRVLQPSVPFTSPLPLLLHSYTRIVFVVRVVTRLVFLPVVHVLWLQRYTPIKITGKKPINIILTFFHYYGWLIL